MITTIYHTVKPVWYVVTRKRLGCIPANTALLGVTATRKQNLQIALGDWLANNGAKRSSVKIMKGFLPGNVTNYTCYSQTPWINA